MSEKLSDSLVSGVELVVRELTDGGFGGEVLGAGDGGYDEARSIWNAMVDKRPGLIARAADRDDVVAVVNAARRHGTPLAVRAGGHGIIGSALADEDGVTLDMTLMREVEVDAARKLVHVEGGCKLGDVANRRADTLGLLGRKRLELARALATDPVVLLLDEIGAGLTDAEAANGVVTHSSGNHAAALARAAQLRGITAHIVMPVNASASKVHNVGRYGGWITTCEPNLNAREAACAQDSNLDGIHAAAGWGWIRRVIASWGKSCGAGSPRRSPWGRARWSPFCPCPGPAGWPGGARARRPTGTARRPRCSARG